MGRKAKGAEFADSVKGCKAKDAVSEKGALPFPYPEIILRDYDAFPFGVTRTGEELHLKLVCRPGPPCVYFYRPGEKKPFLGLDFPLASQKGSVYAMSLRFIRALPLDTEYAFGIAGGGTVFADPYGKAFPHRNQFGKGPSEMGARSRVFPESVPSKIGAPVERPLSDTVFYRLNVRSFTRSAGSGVKDRGSFGGIVEKIPYLKALGVNTLLLMPCQEFDEYGDQEGRTNLWGYAPALHMAPKAAFCGEKRTEDEPVPGAFSRLVCELHQEGLGIFVEFYFDGGADREYIREVLRYWAGVYRIDGFLLRGEAFFDDAFVGRLLRDPYFSRTGIITDRPLENVGHPLHAYMDHVFHDDMRRFLKGDEGMLSAAAEHLRRNPPENTPIRYIADIQGFSLMDAVSYERKHNENNGENNRDGREYNFTWNGGVEGPTRREKIRRLRMQQIRNASLLVFLSQGIPLLCAGDEFGDTKKGNNNAYCQDNGISWLDWGLLETNKALFEWMKAVIAFKKAHPLLRMPREPRLMDTISCGMPDLSYHGREVWKPEFSGWNREIGLLYWGDYARKETGERDNSLYLLFNMHWESHTFYLPRLPRNVFWHLAVDTAGAGEKQKAACIYLPGEEIFLEDQKCCLLNPRSIAVLLARSPGEEEKRKK